MKKIVVIGLCAALLAASIQQVRSHWILYICAAGGTAIIGGITYFVVKGCAPKYYCVKDAEGNRFPSNATRTERALNEWTVVGGPYSSAQAAHEACPPQTNSAAMFPASIAAIAAAQGSTNQNVNDEVFIPAMTFHVERSYDMKNWNRVATLVDDPSHFMWYDTNGVSSASQAFYRLMY